MTLGTGSQAGRASVSSLRPIGTAAALAVALVLPAAAGAAEPFVLDPGGMKPHVAVAENGTGHFVWAVETGGATTDGDEVRYCQVPRGATACTKTHRFDGTAAARTPGATGAPSPRRAGDHHRRAERTATRSRSSQATAGTRSPRRGRSATDGRPTIPSGFRAELGPGEDTVSMLIGGLFQAAPIDGPPPTRMPDLGPQLHGRPRVHRPADTDCRPSGMPLRTDHLPPIRRLREPQHGRELDPAQSGRARGGPDLAGGVSGVYLSYETAAGQLIRRYDQAGDSFGSAQVISGEGGGATISGDLHQSAGGSLHQTWTRPGDAPLQHRRSLDGGGAGCRPRRLQPTRQRLLTPACRHRRDGGGFAVWNDSPAARAGRSRSLTNGELPSSAPRPCRVQVGLAVAIAREGCFERQGSLHTAPGDVRINGIDLSGSGRS